MAAQYVCVPACLYAELLCMIAWLGVFASTLVTPGLLRHVP